MHLYPLSHHVALISIFKISVLPTFMYVYNVHNSAQSPEEGARTPHPKLELQLTMTMWVLGTKPCSFATAVSASNCLAIFPGHFLCF